jgi:hypothetical protein
MDKLQRARVGDFLLRLVAKHGPRGAARVLQALGDELQALANHIARSVQFGGRD